MRKRGRIGVAFLILTVVLVAGLAVAGRQPEPPPLLTLDDAIGFEVAGGWRVVQSPDLAGPYRRGGLPHQTAKGQGGGARWRNRMGEASHQFVSQQGAEQLAVPLETVDGRLTVAVLAR
ncbi:hypothetical protein R5W23_001547 [Gemmata sp. JC673]|uniref:Uncharacterized protein n=1 Tax=Gemmata algarum TaxID=2975278 RepID=A0ABU5EYY1_9BACT|nr:hypothetical protein [Gemmata algarum]MDY3560315.1 hypothetical protein [Gemmata algarum]